MANNNSLCRGANESIEDYKHRLFDLKLNYNALSWDLLTELLNNELSSSERHCRKYWTKAARADVIMSMRSKTIASDTDSEEADSTVDAYEDLVRSIRIERYKLNEERTQNNAYLRKIAREDTLREIAENYADKMSTKKLLDLPDIEFLDGCNEREAILCISDWHYGIEVNNYFNVYNPRVCRARVKQLLYKTIEICEKEHVEKIHLVNLSDLICGRIHLTLRLESREDIISQTMEVAEILAEFITELSKHFIVEYRDCLDNHSRLEPNKKDSLELETLVRIIPWYLETRLADNYNVRIIANSYADDIIAFETLGHNVAAVHGHKDKLNKVIDNMCAMTRRRNDLVLSAHLHHLTMDESHECLRISNGSLMGTDTYAADLRLTNKPSQSLIIVSKENVCDVFYRILLV